MMPCPRHRKNIASWAVDALNAHEARQLQEHLKTCEGCRHYYAEISQTVHTLQSLPVRSDIQTSDKFHGRVLTALKTQDKQPTWQSLLALFHNFHWNWRIALPLSTATAVLLLCITIATRHSRVDAPVQTVNHAASASVPKPDFEPSILNYQSAANRSLENLDELVTQQSLKPSSPTPIYTASSSKQLDAWE